MADKKVMITVMRPFFYNRKRVEIGDQFEVNEFFSSEMIAANKAKLGKVKSSPSKIETGK